MRKNLLEPGMWFRFYYLIVDDPISRNGTCLQAHFFKFLFSGFDGCGFAKKAPFFYFYLLFQVPQHARRDLCPPLLSPGAPQRSVHSVLFLFFLFFISLWFLSVLKKNSVSNYTIMTHNSCIFYAKISKLTDYE